MTLLAGNRSNGIQQEQLINRICESPIGVVCFIKQCSIEHIQVRVPHQEHGTLITECVDHSAWIPRCLWRKVQYADHDGPTITEQVSSLELGDDVFHRTGICGRRTVPQGRIPCATYGMVMKNYIERGQQHIRRIGGTRRQPGQMRYSYLLIRLHDRRRRGNVLAISERNQR
jgi:hypothetical protein